MEIWVLGWTAMLAVSAVRWYITAGWYGYGEGFWLFWLALSALVLLGTGLVSATMALLAH